MISKETIFLNEKAIKIATKKVRDTYSPDKIIMQAVEALSEEEKMINTEYERLREIYWRYFPEVLGQVSNVKQLIKIVKEDRKETSKELKVPLETMGYDLTNDEVKMMREYADIIYNHLKSLGILEAFITEKTEKLAPETSKLATPLLTAKLINLAGSFRELALMPASTIQMLGAEKALFRALRSKARGPKHGVILQHPSVQSSKEKGKAARRLACSISKTIKIDFFRVKKK